MFTLKHRTTTILCVILVTIPLVFYSKTAQSQSLTQHNRIIKWEGISTIHYSEKIKLQSLHFDKAAFLEPNNRAPQYHERFVLNGDNNSASFSIKNKIFTNCSQEEITFIEKNYSKIIKDKILFNSSIGYEMKKAFAHISFFPIRINPANNKIEKLISFTISYSQTKEQKSKPKGITHTNTSVLSSGSWYKFSVKNTGIFKITYNDLIEAGINVQGIDPRKIGIFNNGNGVVPEATYDFRYDDLQENSIYIKGEDDGVFDPNDYILFYGQSPTKWHYDSINDLFHHRINPYTQTTCYFLCNTKGSKRITPQTISSATANTFVSSFIDFKHHELETVNLVKSGRTWYGEEFDKITTYNYSFEFPNLVTSSQIYLRTNVIARASSNSSFSVNANNNIINISVQAINPNDYNGNFANTRNNDSYFLSNSSSISLSIDYNKPNSSAVGWLNYLELNAKRELVFTGGQMLFRNTDCVGQNNISEFSMSNAPTNIRIWETTDPVNIQSIPITFSGNGSDMTFRIETPRLREFISFDETIFHSAEFEKLVNNQNLHNNQFYDFIIISHPEFLSQAERLATIHRDLDKMSVLVVTPDEIYNEFSSGVQDISAIRDFVKMFYDRASTDDELPKYLLLFGDGSYDYLNHITNNSNYIPTYESVNAHSVMYSYATDDFYGYLDDVDYSGGSGSKSVDIGIGRFVVSTKSEAKNAVDKVEYYVSKSFLSDNSSSSSTTSSNFSAWRNTICFVADDEDGNLHLSQANKLATYVDTTYLNYNVDKIFIDAFKQEYSSGGQRYPDANAAINREVEKGALIINYTGHGGETGWAHEGILTIPDINSWRNKYNLPVFVTATCEFSRFDDPERTSAGELIFLREDGGAIALFSTIRIAYSNVNYRISEGFYKNALKKTSQEYPRLGDIIRSAKNYASAEKNFILLGDPALKLAYPAYQIETTACTDTLKALSEITVSGFIKDDNNNKISNFNGTLFPTVFDKKTLIKTLVNDPRPNYTEQVFSIQNNIIYKGKVDVKKGEFSFSFFVPKDIAYNYGEGKISYYATNYETDASGYYNPLIGGTNPNAPSDYSGPTIELFLNDTNFVFGGITDENPILMAIISDSTAINTVGNGIGHDITAILDDKSNNPIILNDYFEADLNKYNSGIIKYPLSDLEEGMHSLSIKAWDVHNNSSNSYTEFIVSDSEDFAISHLLNYPNPFSSYTEFHFEHNQPFKTLNIQIQIFTITGRIVKTIDAIIETNGYISKDISWDGRDNYGDKIGKGVYIYRLKAFNDNGSMVSETEKLVVLR